MDVITSALKSTQSLEVSDSIKAVCKAVAHLKDANEEDAVKSFLQTVQFESPFEKLIAVKLIDAFQLKDNLVSAISTEDLFVFSQILRCHWFFEDESGLSLNKDNLLIFFSKLSYSVRCKVVRKYAKLLKDSDKAESMFAILEDEYGIKTALELLPACSESFITDIIYSKNVVIPSSVVKQLYKKYPEFVMDFLFSYFEKKNKSKLGYRNFNETYPDTLKRMASEKTSLFIEFWNKYGSGICLDKFGRFLTRKILKVGYSSVLRNSEIYMKILKIKLVVAVLSKSQIEELHLCLLPKTINKFDESIWYYNKGIDKELIECLKGTFAEELLLKNFRKKYGKEPLELKSDNWIPKFPQEIRTQWAEKQLLEKDLDIAKKASFVAFLPCDKSFDTLKSFIPLALDLGQRINVIESMMKSAKINKDVSAASRVVKFIVERFRNDMPQVRGKPLEELKEGFNLMLLSVDEWAPIIELINIMIINNDIDNFTSELLELYGKWIHRRLIENLPVDSEMKLLLKYINYYFDFNIAANSEFEWYCLNWFNDNLDKKDFANDHEKKNFAARLFCKVNDFNSKKPKKIIEHKDWIIEVMTEKLKERYEQEDIIKSLKKDKPLRIKLYDSVFPEIITPQILLHKLNSNVADIVNNVPQILSTVTSKSFIYPYKSFFRKLLLYTDLPNKFTEHCLIRIKSDGKTEEDEEEFSTREKENCIKILSFFGNADVFLSFTQDFYPTGPKAESEGNEAYNKYRLQSAICSSLKNINPPYRALEAIKKFSLGDYLKLVHGSILSVSLKVSQTKSKEFMNQNLDTPVSFRKHIIRVFRLVASKREISSLLLTSFKNEKNISIRIILLNSIFDLIKNDKCLLSWETVKESFSLMNETDVTQLKSKIFYSHDIPDEYIAEYIETVWANLNRLDFSDDFKMNIFSLINETTILLIKDEFADLLLSMTYNEFKVEHTGTWSSYISYYLNYSKSENYELRLTAVIHLIKNKFSTLIGKELNSLECLPPIIDVICTNSMSDDVIVSPPKLLSDLHTNLLAIFPEQEIVKTTFKLSLYQIFCKIRPNLISFADEICSLIDSVCTTYGSHLIQIFSSLVENFITSHFPDNSKDPEKMLVFAHRIITGPASPLNKIVGVSLLPNLSDLEMENEIKLYKSTISAIKSSPDQSLKIFARHHIYDM